MLELDVCPHIYICIVPLCLDAEATGCLAILRMYSSSCITTQAQVLCVVATLQLLTLIFGVFRYKYYVTLFLWTYLMPYKKHYDIVDVAHYIVRLFGAKAQLQLWVRVWFDRLAYF